MPLFTVQSGKVFRLLDLIRTGKATDGTTDVTTASRLIAGQNNHASRCFVRVPNGSPGSVLLAFNYATPSTTDYDLPLYAGDQFTDVLHVNGNCLSLDSIYLVVTVDNTLVSVAALNY